MRRVVRSMIGSTEKGRFMIKRPKPGTTNRRIPKQSCLICI
jgi:hypothetical protein